jgi:hypothetical protein
MQVILINGMMRPEEILQRYNHQLSQFRKHRAGGFIGTSLDGEWWAEVMRKDAVKFGNLYKKRTGRSPPGFAEVSKR